MIKVYYRLLNIEETVYFEINFGGFRIESTGFIPRNKNKRRAAVNDIYFRFFHISQLMVEPLSSHYSVNNSLLKFFEITDEYFIKWLKRIRINHIVGHSEVDLEILSDICDSLKT